MLTRLRITHFKRFGQVEIELGNPVVFIGPNNSGKTTALQALALWEAGLRSWLDRRVEPPSPAAINRLYLTAIPVPEAEQLWRNLQTVRRSAEVSELIPIEIVVEGLENGRPWSYGFGFRTDNPESLLCEPLPPHIQGQKIEEVPEAAQRVRTAFLTSSSGVVSNEPRLDAGAIDVRIGEGRTGEVLRNLCYLAHLQDPEGWSKVTETIRHLFGVELEEPEYVKGRGEVRLAYRDHGHRFDLVAAGRGLHQTLLLLAYTLTHRGAVLLLDEPDAHLEILRQRQVYQTLTELAAAYDCQIVVSSHSEVLLNEAADRDVVVAFVGKPHRIDDRGSQVAKSLKEIGFEHYFLAEQRGWVLYLEGSTDLAILQAFARTLDHPAAPELERPFVEYVGNQPMAARHHFFALREAKPDLVGLALYDRLGKGLPSDGTQALVESTWERREIENYVAAPEILERYVERTYGAEAVDAMRQSIVARVPPAALADLNDPWWTKNKASGDFLDPVFELFFRSLGLPNQMSKTNYHVLASLVPADRIAPEVRDKLDALVSVAQQARPAE